MKNKKRLILVLLLVAIAIFAGERFIRLKYQGKPENVVRISGNIEVTQTEVSFKIPGRVQERLVSEGETIGARQLVALLDKTEFIQEVALRGAEVAAAQAALAELEAGSRPEEIAQARAALDRAQFEADRLRSDYARQFDLYRKDVISAREYETAKTAYDSAVAKVREAEQHWILLKKGPRKEKIDQARALLEQARQALALAETKLGHTTLLSPHSGVILSKNIEPGEYVSAGTPVITIADIVNIWLRGYINETDLGRVKLGQTARVKTDTYPDKVYDGQVSFIAEQAEFTPKNVQTEKERVKLVYRVKVDIVNPNMELKAGMPADADILLTGQGK
jgi:HlyD family secretion protein